MKFSKERLLLICGLILSAFAVVLIHFVLNDVPEKVNFGYEFGQVLSNLSLAYISSYIFYLVLVIPKEKSDRKNINGILYKLTDRLISRAYSIYNVIIEATNTPRDKYDKRTITLEEYKELCRQCERFKILPNRFMDLDGIPATPAAVIHNNCFGHVATVSSQIKDLLPVLNSTYVKLLYAVVDSFFFQFTCRNVIDVRLKNENLEAWANEMYQYLEAVRDLERYNDMYNKY